MVRASITELLASINRDALIARAEELRGGRIKCTLEFPPSRTSPSSHSSSYYHAFLNFADGDTWLAQFSLNTQNHPRQRQINYIRRSEYATYAALARTTVPAPKVFGVADDGDPRNRVGPGYILIEKLLGSPLPLGDLDGKHEDDLPRQDEALYQQFADIYIALLKMSFDRIGTLQLSTLGEVEVGAAYFEYSPAGEATPRGPFSTTDEAYKDMIRMSMKVLREEEEAAGAARSRRREDGFRFTHERLDSYLALRTLLDHLPPNDHGPFYLRHCNLHGGNVFVDDSGHITGIVGWQSGFVMGRHAAFESPYVLEEYLRFADVLQDRGEEELANAAVNLRHTLFENLVRADPYDEERFTRALMWWWKAETKRERFDYKKWWDEAFEKYGDGSGS